VNVKVYTVVITGASGSVYGLRLVRQLLGAGHAVTLTATSAGRDVMAFETGFALPAEGAEQAVLSFLGVEGQGRLRVVAPDDLFDPIASGSQKVDATVVIPASMGFVGSVASGLASDLPERAADVALKERRTLVMVPRETPLNLVHLRNLTTLAEAGAVVVPAMPAFYHKPETLDDAVDFVVGKVLDVLGVEHDLFTRWGE
jgi:4-hydroxy-3-polyprenylbenzoate decarboxylase